MSYVRTAPASPYIGSMQAPRGAYVGAYGYQQPLTYNYPQGMMFPPYGNWDQFETNEALFGVKSTFDEELYTTKLEKGPKMRELEREALRIAREIEGEDTQDLHAAEERGMQPYENFDIDEETRYSSVYRGEVVDDSGYDEDEDILLDSRNTETFGGSPGSEQKSSIDWTSGKGNHGVQDYTHYSESNVAPELYRSGSYDHARQLASEPPNKSFASTAGESSEHVDTDSATDSVEKHMLAGDSQTSKPDGFSKKFAQGLCCNKGTS
ncbi:polyadenylate-binding protein-interacting protein 3 isoform X2 [Rosa chinensis]|uniref:polyadenylate-binding protein-interacting protein 3 isoform X2 n=1 Tax=Rosa chinensis TaxID=74649 RepID=UPI001AD8F154|nr:polyadenylate-binding protein-interacting protein 3 isoform X2 [Rosa chinensis]